VFKLYSVDLFSLISAWLITITIFNCTIKCDYNSNCSAVTTCESSACVCVCFVCRDPLPLSISHIPICISFAFFDSGNFMLVDPTQKEQLVAEGMVHVAMNKHREVCMIETSGCVMLELEQVSVRLSVTGLRKKEKPNLMGLGSFRDEFS